MDGFLTLVDELRKRGAIEVSTDFATVKFSSPLQPAVAPEPEQKPYIIEKPQDLDALLFTETANL
jgi:hypothetical protein